MTVLGPRFTTIDADPKVAARQNSENARDTRQAFGRFVPGYLVNVERYTATGSVASQIRVGVRGTPLAIQLVRAAATYDRSGNVNAWGSSSFYMDDASKAAVTFEPDGLTADTVYDLVFLVLDGGA